MSTQNQESKPMVRRKLTAKEQAGIAAMKQRGFVRSEPVFQASIRNDKDALDLAEDPNLETEDARELVMSRMAEATGTPNLTGALSQLTAIGTALVPASATVKDMAVKLDAATQSMRTLAPQDGVEGQLIAQLVVLQEHAMTWLGKAMHTNRPDFANIYLNGASKLLTRHHEALDALLKYRRRGEQRVHVEHVHVHGGGQAIVGTVTSGGGLNQKSEEGPHAKV